MALTFSARASKKATSSWMSLLKNSPWFVWFPDFLRKFNLELR